MVIQKSYLRQLILLFEYAQRIKGLGRQQLSTFKHRKHYEGQEYLLLPDHYIRENHFEDQWDDVLRFIATIRLKVKTASQLFKRLNSYSKQHPLYRALKEFGKIPKSLFILKYCDDLQFRQAIEKQLNKVESSNKFSKAVLLVTARSSCKAKRKTRRLPKLADG